jgi:hypothetical protein
MAQLRRRSPQTLALWDLGRGTNVHRRPGRPATLSDRDRWRRVIFDFTAYTTFERMDDSFSGYGSSINDQEKTLTLIKPADKNWKANLTFNRPAPDQLVLHGSMDGHQVQMKLKLLDRNKFALVNRRFHWIKEYPY